MPKTTKVSNELTHEEKILIRAVLGCNITDLKEDKTRLGKAMVAALRRIVDKLK